MTPGQAAYEALHASRAAREGDVPWRVPWEDLDAFPDMNIRRADFEAAGQAVLNQAFPGLRRQLDEARAAIAAAPACPCGGMPGTACGNLIVALRRDVERLRNAETTAIRDEVVSFATRHREEVAEQLDLIAQLRADIVRMEADAMAGIRAESAAVGDLARNLAAVTAERDQYRKLHAGTANDLAGAMAANKRLRQALERIAGIASACDIAADALAGPGA